MNLLDDPFDSDDFDPVAYINERFPTEASLDNLDSFVVEVNQQIADIDDELSHIIQTQSLSGGQLTKDILGAHSYIDELFEKIQEIKEKASQSETMVQDLCADIKKLDCAKNHLQTSITSLNRLQMLMSAVSQLELLAAEMQFKDAANLYDAVKQFMIHFDKYKHITVIFDLNNRIEQIREFLTRKIKKMFQELSQNIDTVADAELALPSIPGGLKTITDSCLMVDALGPAIKRQLLDDFVQGQLASYELLFGPGKEHFNLNDMERRWSWFKRLLKYIDSKFKSVFPIHWRIQLRLCLEFIERTKMHLISLLTEYESQDHNNVDVLLKSLNSALRFEREMGEKFNILRELKESKAKDEAAAKVRADELEREKKLKRDDKLMYIPTDHDAENSQDETESGFLGLAHAAISGGLSGVFDKFLGSYVTYERQQLEEMLATVSAAEDVTSNEGSSQGSLNVYGSSTNMFLFIKKAISRCITLTTGNSFLALTEEFRQCIMEYISMLKNRCPPEVSSNPPVYKLPPNGELTMAYIINTCEYCAEVLPQLEQMIQQKINPNLANKVNFEEEVDAFMDLVAYCLRVLVYGVMDKLEPQFRIMQNSNWANLTQVGEESAYLHAINAILIELIPNLRSTLSSSYFNNFCTKLATEMMQRFLDAILKQKKISEPATQQLLLDVYNIKSLMLHLPALSPELSINKTTPATGMFAKLVNTKCTYIEMVLKLVGTPDDMLLDRFKIMWPDGSATDLQMIMNLKGTKRPDQQAILEMLGLSKNNSSTNGNNAANGNNTNNQHKISSMLTGAGTAASSSISQGTTSLNSAASNLAAQTAATSAAAFTSMKNLTQDLSSATRNAVGNLKWTKS